MFTVSLLAWIISTLFSTYFLLYWWGISFEQKFSCRIFKLVWWLMRCARKRKFVNKNWKDQLKKRVFHKGENVFSLIFSLDRTDPISFRPKLFNSYWMRLSMISWIIKTEVCVRLRQIIQTRGFDNSWYHAKTEFNNCFIIHFLNNRQKKTFSHSVYEENTPRGLVTRQTLNLTW